MKRERRELGNSEKRERGGRVKGTGLVPGVYEGPGEEEGNTSIEVIVRII
jgi:hypothetical protein